MGLWQNFVDWLSADDVPSTKDVTFTPADAGTFGGFLPRTRYSYGRDIRNGLDSNVIMAPVRWICRNFTQADVVVERRVDRTWSEAVEHDLKRLLDKPNDFYDGDMLWKATLVSRELDGNAYWRKVRNELGEVIQLWYIPHFLIKPKWPDDGSQFISHYEFSPFGSGIPVRVPVRDIVHFRSGLDPRNQRLGMSALKPLLREVFTDEEASNFSASILRNMGVPGGVLSPKDIGALPNEDEVEEMKDYMQTAFTGDKRGEWFVTGVPTDLKQFGFDPGQLLLTNLRDISEERVCATLGIPAAVVGFGSGLQQTKVGATMRELREEAWASGVEPRMRTLARAVTDNLVPDFQTQVRRFRVRFDTSRVPALMERNASVQGDLVKAGIQRVDRAQEALGLEVDDSQAVYLRPSTTIAVPAETDPQQLAQQSPPNGGPPDEVTVNRLQQMLSGTAEDNGGSDE